TLLPTERGRIVVNADLAVRDHPGLWAIGDCAFIHNARDNAVAPPTAQFAVAEARALANNLVAAINGEPTCAFSYRSRGSMAAIGHRKGVANIGGLQGILAKLQQAGYGQQAQSWIGTGPNLPIDPRILQQVLGQGQLGQIAQQLGITREQASDGVAQMLPQVVDQMTPAGQIPENQSDLVNEA